MTGSAQSTKALSPPEFWLTPFIGLTGLALYILLHDDGTLAHKLSGRVIPAILFGAIPLLAAALAQWRVRTWNWPAWAQVIAAGLISCLAVGACYFYAASHYNAIFATLPALDPESQGDAVTLLQYEAPSLGAIGAASAIFSTIFTVRLTRRRA